MVLRPELYRRLEQRFHSVVVVFEDEEMSAHEVTDQCEVDRRGRPLKKLIVDDRGETFRVNCPFCSDTKQRLWINHTWGYKDPVTKRKRLYLVKCFNEDCLKVKWRRDQLYDMVFDDVGYGQQLFNDRLLRGRKSSPVPVKAEPPGEVVNVFHLPPDHPACQYLTFRGYDPKHVGPLYKVCYCTNPKPEYYPVAGRLVFPVYMRGVLSGWQARYLGTPTKDNPKYWTMRGMTKSHLLYNYDEARKYNHVVVVEGVFDAWRYGPEAVAIFGKHLSSYQAGVIASAWNPRPIFCLLDGEARKENENMVAVLARNHPFVIRVDLPSDKDPDACTQEFLRGEVLKAATAAGIAADQLEGLQR